MPTIPTVPLSAVPQAPALAPRGDAGAYNATNRAITQAGGALVDVGQAIGRFAIQKQEQVNKGLLASEETIRMETAASVEAYATNNPDKPETWEAFRQSAWKGYEQGRSKRMKDQKWGPAVVEQDNTLTKSYQAETGIRFRTMQDKAMIRQANGRLAANAKEHLASGNVKAAVASINGMTLFDDQRREMLAEVTNGAEYEKANRSLSDVEQTPVASQVEELAAMENFYTQQNAKGEFLNGWVEDEAGNRVGGLGINGRNDIIQRIRAQKEQAGRAQVRSLAPVLDAYEMGGPEMGDAAAQAAIERGDMTREFAEKMKPAMAGAVAKRAEGLAKAEDAEAKAAQARDRAQFDEFERMKARVDELTPREIAQREKNGDIASGQAKELRARMSGMAIAELDMARPIRDARGKEVKQGADPRVIVDAFVAKYATAGKDATVEEREAALNSIAQAPIATETKAALMRKLIQGFDTDFRKDYMAAPTKEARSYVGPGLTTTTTYVTRSGRKITAAEAQTRSRIYGTLLQSGELGQGWTAEALMGAERELAEFYEGKQVKAAEALAMEERLTRKIADQGSLRILDGVIYNR